MSKLFNKKNERNQEIKDALNLMKEDLIMMEDISDENIQRRLTDLANQISKIENILERD